MKHLLRVPLVAGRAFSSSSRQMKNRVAEAQKLFQKDSSLPVHLKGGSFDNLMYRITMTLCLAGTCYSLYSLCVAAMPQKKE